mgnify:CR=1 FL=1
MSIGISNVIEVQYSSNINLFDPVYSRVTVNSKPENARLELASEMGLNLKPSDLHSSIGIANIENLKHQAQVLKKIHNLYKNTIKNKKICSNFFYLLNMNFAL